MKAMDEAQAASKTKKRKSSAKTKRPKPMPEPKPPPQRPGGGGTFRAYVSILSTPYRTDKGRPDWARIVQAWKDDKDAIHRGDAPSDVYQQSIREGADATRARRQQRKSGMQDQMSAFGKVQWNTERGNAHEAHNNHLLLEYNARAGQNEIPDQQQLLQLPLVPRTIDAVMLG